MSVLRIGRSMARRGGWASGSSRLAAADRRPAGRGRTRVARAHPDLGRDAGQRAGVDALGVALTVHARRGRRTA